MPAAKAAKKTNRHGEQPIPLVGYLALVGYALAFGAPVLAMMWGRS